MKDVTSYYKNVVLHYDGTCDDGRILHHVQIRGFIARCTFYNNAKKYTKVELHKINTHD